MKSVKDSLNKVVKNARLNYDKLIAVLIEIKAMINSRPLTYLSEESNIAAIWHEHRCSSRNEFNTARCKHWRFDESSEIYSAVTEPLLETISQRIHSCYS